MMDEQVIPSYVVSDAQKALDQKANEDAGLVKNTTTRDFIAEMAQAGAAQVQEISQRPKVAEKAKQIREQGGSGFMTKMKDVARNLYDWGTLLADSGGRDYINQGINESVQRAQNKMAEKINAQERRAKAYASARVEDARVACIDLGYAAATEAFDVVMPIVNGVDASVAKVMNIPDRLKSAINTPISNVCRGIGQFFMDRSTNRGSAAFKQRSEVSRRNTGAKNRGSERNSWRPERPATPRPPVQRPTAA